MWTKIPVNSCPSPCKLNPRKCECPICQSQVQWMLSIVNGKKLIGCISECPNSWEAHQEYESISLTLCSHSLYSLQEGPCPLGLKDETMMAQAGFIRSL